MIIFLINHSSKKKKKKPSQIATRHARQCWCKQKAEPSCTAPGSAWAPAAAEPRLMAGGKVGKGLSLCTGQKGHDTGFCYAEAHRCQLELQYTESQTRWCHQTVRMRRGGKEGTFTGVGGKNFRTPARGGWKQHTEVSLKERGHSAHKRAEQKGPAKQIPWLPAVAIWLYPTHWLQPRPRGAQETLLLDRHQHANFSPTLI